MVKIILPDYVQVIKKTSNLVNPFNFASEAGVLEEASLRAGEDAQDRKSRSSSRTWTRLWVLHEFELALIIHDSTTIVNYPSEGQPFIGFLLGIKQNITIAVIYTDSNLPVVL